MECGRGDFRRKFRVLVDLRGICDNVNGADLAEGYGKNWKAWMFAERDAFDRGRPIAGKAAS